MEAEKRPRVRVGAGPRCHRGPIACVRQSVDLIVRRSAASACIIRAISIPALEPARPPGRTSPSSSSLCGGEDGSASVSEILENELATVEKERSAPTKHKQELRHRTLTIPASPVVEKKTTRGRRRRLALPRPAHCDRKGPYGVLSATCSAQKGTLGHHL